MANYSLSKTLSKNDKRQKRWKKQRKDRGFDDTEIWNLYLTIAKFVLPRLKVFKDNVCGYPQQLNPEEWTTILQEIIDGFEFIVNEDNIEYTEEVNNTINKSIELLSKYYFHLWD